MSCFTAQPERLAPAVIDPTKHVNYVQGMILGEDDFKQEFAYLSGRDQWLARDLIGYGTVRGLGVRTEWDGDKGPRIYIDPGVAVTPPGQLVCVPSPQCANVNAWLAKHRDEVQKAVASPPANPLSLYVVLCYRDCATDDVPIPGEPCRTEDQLVKPSRLRDDFVLELTLTRPVQREERALRDFCVWLRQIDMSDPDVTSVELDRFLDEIRHAAAPWFSPPSSPPPGDFLFGSLPGWLRVHPDDACRYLRAAFHLWVTELRPKWIARWYGCAPDLKEPAPLEDCVLLAEVQVCLVAEPGTGVFKAVDGVLPVVVQEDRPFIVHLRLLQEWLLCGPRPEARESVMGLGFGSPPGARSYGIVAAGVLTAKVGGPVRSPVFNNLRVVRVVAGLVTFAFDGYRPPDGTFQYIVKALAVSNPALPVPAVRFLEFRAEGFVLRVTRGVALVSVATLENVEFMIEVSRYGQV